MNKIIIVFLLFFTGFSFSQFTREDTLRGSITPERAWWDLLNYELEIEVFPKIKSIQGKNTIYFKAIQQKKTLQIDLQNPLEIDSVLYYDKHIYFEQISKNVYHVTFPKALPKNEENSITIFYHGKPKIAIRAPWDGGFVWATHQDSIPFIATACQGLGASAWWPCKDHMYDEPDDGMTIQVTAPDSLMNVSNGQLIFDKTNKSGKRTTKWQVINPINNYGVNVNVSNYAHWDTIYDGVNGPLKMDFYVLPENLEKSKTHFQDAFKTMEAFEYWFGPYPFYEDGYKLVEVPYLGMEHQSSVTYGNQYKKGYLGGDLSGSGWGLKWDYIIVHESGHEWFANNITNKDAADMWIHEGFTTYSEALFVEYYYGKKAGAEYVRGMRTNIRNDRPIIGEYDVNHTGSGDMYYKGSNILHTLRQVIDKDPLWHAILVGLNEEFRHKTVSTDEVENYISLVSDLDLEPFFDQYLRTANIPVLKIEKKRKKVNYYWENVVDGFNMPIDVCVDGEFCRLHPTTQIKSIKCTKFVPSKDYLVEIKK